MSSLIPPLPAQGRVLPTKVVLRLLPPTITEPDVLDALPKEFKFEHSKFVPGRRLAKPSPENPNLNARMYLAFKSFPVASEFIAKVHGKVLSDQNGVSYRIVAAFAPFQRVAKSWKQLKNPHEGTIESVEHFKKFIANETQDLDSPKRTAELKERKPGFVSPLVASLITPKRRVNDKIDGKSSLNVGKKTDKPKPESKKQTGAKPKPKVKPSQPPAVNIKT